jgi:Sigma-70 region 2
VNSCSLGNTSIFYADTPSRIGSRQPGNHELLAAGLQEGIGLAIDRGRLRQRAVTQGFMNTGESEDEITVKLLAAAATDEILVAAAKLGDRPAFAELWARHSKKSLQIAYQITKNREDAEDVLQEAWTKAYVHLKSFDGKARFSTWLTRIAINTALMTLRRKRARPKTFAEFMAEICSSRNRRNPRLY